MNTLKTHLDAMAAKFNVPAFIESDPVQFPHMFSRKPDIEIAALLAAVIAWGGRAQILKSCRRMLCDIMEGSPAAFVTDGHWQKINPAQNIHRTFFGRDLMYICKGLQGIYSNGGSLEDLWAGTPNVWEGIENLRQTLCRANGCYSKHIPNPLKSACKRLNMMLRWLCRRDGIVDLGIWQAVDPSLLMIPLDVHSARTARSLHIIERRQNDRTAVELLTAALREFCPSDPAKYDFALFGKSVNALPEPQDV